MQVRLSVIRGREAPQLLHWHAASVQQARERAEQAGYIVVSAQSVGTWSAWISVVTSFQPTVRNTSIASDELLVWVEQLHALLNAGLSVIEALDTLLRQRQTAQIISLQSLQNQLREGMTLSSAMQAQSLFPPLLVALVRSSEQTSSLSDALERYLEHERRAAYVRHQVSSIALYPMLLLGVGGLVMIFLAFYVMPRFARIFQGMQGDLPWTAQLMVTWSQLIKTHGAWVWAGLIGMIALVLLVTLTRMGREWLFQQLSRQQWLAHRLDTYHLARWYRTTSMLVKGGIPLPESVKLAAHVLPRVMQERAQAVLQGMQDGLPPGQAFSQKGMSTAVAERLIQAGERSGDVGLMLEKAAEFHEVELTRWLERSMRVLEPVVMIAIGLGIGGVVIMMYLPIFELASAIQ